MDFNNYHWPADQFDPRGLRSMCDRRIKEFWGNSKIECLKFSCINEDEASEVKRIMQATSPETPFFCTYMIWRSRP